MSEVEVASFLREQVKVQVTSLDRDGGPEPRHPRANHEKGDET